MTTATAPIVIDASAAVKRVLDEQWTDQVKSLFTDSLDADRPLYGPPHLMSEGTNAIFQRVRNQNPAVHLTEAEAEANVRRFAQLPLQLVAPAGLYERAFSFALAQALPSTYDSLYVVLAELLGTELWTADRRLYNAVRQAAPWVRWIGDYPIS